jgi:hypothetical protein
VQQHERARTFGIEGTAVQQIGEGTDGGEAVVEGVQDVGCALIEDDVLDLG